MKTYTGLLAIVLLAGTAGVAQAKPDLTITQVEIACISLVPVAPNPMPARYIHRRCDTDHQAELSVTIENVGDAEAVLDGQLWNLVGQSAPIVAFAQAATNTTYYPPINVTQPGPIQAYPVSFPKSRPVKLKPGIRWTDVVVLVPIKQLTVGSHSFSVRVDPQNKLEEASEGNNSRSLTLAVATPPPDEEWVNCPAVGVPTLVEPTLENDGKVHCKYLHPDRPSEIMTARVVESQYLKPFRACLRSNEQYSTTAPRGGTYSGRMYCSFKKSMAQLVQSATGWSATGKRVRFGYRSVDGNSEDLEICRVQYDGERRVGRAWRNRCYIPYKGGEQRIDQGFEYLVLTQAYGVPGVEYYKLQEKRNIQPVVDAAVPEPIQFRFCMIGPTFPKGIAATLGLEPNLMLAVPGVLIPGDLCVSSAQGKAISTPLSGDSKGPGGVLILL